MAHPWYDMAWGLADFNENVYLDLSGPHAQVNGLNKIEREGFGFLIPGVDLYARMIWGSDNIDTVGFFERTRQRLMQLGCEKYLEGIFGNTIARLLNLPL